MKHEIKVTIEYDGLKVEHAIPVGNIYAAMRDCKAYCGVPVDVELTTILESHIGMTLTPPTDEVGNPFRPDKPFVLRQMCADLIESIKKKVATL
jgi:hypothetical protein